MSYRVTPRCLHLVALFGVLVVAPMRTEGQPLRNPPSGAEIEASARSLSVNSSAGGVHQIQGRRVSFAPVSAGRGLSREALERGAAVGVVDIEGATPAGGVPAGHYILYLASVGGRWWVFAENNGKIVRSQPVQGRLLHVLDRGRGATSTDLSINISGLPYAACFYGCWLGSGRWYGAVQCEDDCSKRYPI